MPAGPRRRAADRLGRRRTLLLGTVLMIGAALSPSLAGVFLGIPALFSAPFFLAGGLKIVYDVLLYRRFRGLKAPEEMQTPRASC